MLGLNGKNVKLSAKPNNGSIKKFNSVSIAESPVKSVAFALNSKDSIRSVRRVQSARHLRDKAVANSVQLNRKHSDANLTPKSSRKILNSASQGRLPPFSVLKDAHFSFETDDGSHEDEQPRRFSKSRPLSSNSKDVDTSSTDLILYELGSYPVMEVDRKNAFVPLHLDMNIAEQPENMLRDSNNSRGSLFPDDGLLMLINTGNTDIGKSSGLTTESLIADSSTFIEPFGLPNQVPSSSDDVNFDMMLLEQTGSLMDDVESLCGKIGLKTSSFGTMNRAKPVPGRTFSLPDNLIDLDTLCPLLPLGPGKSDSVDPQSSQNPNAPGSGRSIRSRKTGESPRVVRIADPPVSDGSAARLKSPKCSPNNSDVYARIVSALKHIEEEEKNSEINVNQSSSAMSMPEIVHHEIPFFIKNSPCFMTQTICMSKSHESHPNLSSAVSTCSHHSQTLPNIDGDTEIECCSARSTRSHEYITEPITMTNRPKSAADSWETANEKTKNIFSFLDDVERTDRETLFNLRYDPYDPLEAPKKTLSVSGPQVFHKTMKTSPFHHMNGDSAFPLQTMDSLIRKGSVELAREVVILERKVEETVHQVGVLEETLINQRELNVRNLKNSEKELRKRLKLQQEEFEMAFARSQTFIDQLISEKRALQDKCEKALKDSKAAEEKYLEQFRSVQDKHLEELKRLRKVQANTESIRKQKWIGSKTQEIRDMTMKGLEPEVARIIQRHQQEMSELRAYQADELRDTEERWQRKLHIQLQELREKCSREKEDAVCREREQAAKRIDSEIRQKDEDFESQKRRLLNELHDERERFASDGLRMKDSLQDNVRKAQIKGEVEVENVKKEYETKIANMEKRHDQEIHSLKDVYEAERDNWVGNYEKRYDQAMLEKETEVVELMKIEKEKELREKEKKLREEVDKMRKEEEEVAESRIKRIQEKFQEELNDLEKSERDLKNKFTSVKAELLTKEEELFSLRTTLNLKERQNGELQESNTRMMEERANLTAIIRREFLAQMETLEDECRTVKANIVELLTKHRIDCDQHALELEKIRNEKDAEMDKVGLRVKQALTRKEETITELHKQLEKTSFRIAHLEQLLDQQRQDFVESMTISTTSGPISSSKKPSKK